MKIYTRTGDKGETSLFTGQRVPKTDPIIEAIGAVDECNSAVATALSLLPADHSMDTIREQLVIIQHALFDAGASLATPRTRAVDSKLKKTRFDHEEIKKLETWMDEMEEKLPGLKSFILPGGHPAGAALHLARSICRRAERRAIPLDADVADTVLIYLNRLSDYLFFVSRYVNYLMKSPEVKWMPHMLKDENNER